MSSNNSIIAYVDCSYFVHRNFNTYLRDLNNGVMYGFLRSMQVVQGVFNTRYNVPDSHIRFEFCFDSLCEYRKSIYDGYKATRNVPVVENPTDKERKELDRRNTVFRHMTETQRLLNKLQLSTHKIRGLEADDIIAHLVTQHREMYLHSKKQCSDLGNLTQIILSPDRDFNQLLTYNIVRSKHSSIKFEPYSLIDVIADYGIHGEQLCQYRAFVGDVADNIPGINGVAELYLMNYVRGLTAAIPDKARRAIDKFIDEGHFDINMQLMKLPGPLDSTIDDDVKRSWLNKRHSCKDVEFDEWNDVMQEYGFRSLIRKRAS